MKITSVVAEAVITDYGDDPRTLLHNRIAAHRAASGDSK